MSRQVLVLQRRLTHYRVPFFDRLRATLDQQGIRLVVAHGTPSRAEGRRSDSGSLRWAVSSRTYYPMGSTRPSWLRIPWSMVRSSDLVILPHENGFLDNAGVFAQRSNSLKVAFWGHGPLPQSLGSPLSERLKRMTARWPDWWFAYTSLSVDRVAATGFPRDRITCVQNSQEFATHSPEALQVALASDPDLAQLRLLGRHTGVYLGSLAPEKKLGFLVSACDEVWKKVPDFHLIVIGDGSERPSIARAAATRPWMHVVGARTGAEKEALCRLAGVMLNPGMVGLGILDSFAFGTPLVTTAEARHSPEIAYLRDGENGLVTHGDARDYASAVIRLFEDDALRNRLVAGCATASRTFTLDNFVASYASGVVSAMGREPCQPPFHIPSNRAASAAMRVAIVVRSMLPYHHARIGRLRTALADRGIRLFALEVASDDRAYGFPHSNGSGVDHCCFPRTDFQSLDVLAVRHAVLSALENSGADVVLGPATPFPEAMASLVYRERSGARYFMMDDAWERTDSSSRPVHLAKRLIHASVDGVFVPHDIHIPYFESLGFARDRIVTGVDVVDNGFFRAHAERARARAEEVRRSLGLPPRYFVFAGRFLQRKGLPDLLEAYAQYRATHGDAIDLVLVGGTPQDLPSGIRTLGGVVAVGRRYGEELARMIGLASALVVPSVSDQWGLIVNEGMASGVPVIVSEGCGAAALVDHGTNGWKFAPGDTAALSRLLAVAGHSHPDEIARVVARASDTIRSWDLDRFVAGVLALLDIPRRAVPRPREALAARLWRGRIRTY